VKSHAVNHSHNKGNQKIVETDDSSRGGHSSDDSEDLLSDDEGLLGAPISGTCPNGDSLIGLTSLSGVSEESNDQIVLHFFLVLP